MKKGFLVAIILIAVLTCAFALVACAEVSTTVTYMVDGEVFKTVTVTGTGQSDPGFTPSKSGYTFGGWYTDTALRTPFDFEAYAANNERGDIVVYGKWEVNTYTATFMVGGNIIIEEVRFDADDMYVDEPDVPQRTGYTGEWEDYEIKAENLTINAVYTPITYNITYENTLGAVNTNPATYNIESEITLSELTSPGYTFEGWFAGEEKVESIELGSYGDITLTAKWTLTQYTATFVNSDGTVGTVGFDIEDTALSEPAVPLRTGYTGAWEDYEIKAEDLTINAVYTPITYNITYENTLGAANGNPATYNIETAITLSDITAPGYTFEGWFVGEEKVESIELGSYGDITLTAKWSIIEYSVNYVLDGGINAAANPSTYTVETLGGADGVIALEDPSKNKTILDSNYLGGGEASVTYTTFTFDGWYKDSGFEQRVSELSLSLGSVTLYAKWTEGSETTTEQVYTRSGNYIYFGEYPQTIKAADVTVGDVADEDGYYLGSDGERYAKVVADPYNIRSYKFSDNSSVTSGNTYYFKVEPIRWRILSESDGNAFILCDSIIANKAYASSNNNYANSDIRAWLNDEFYNTAFGELQQALIQTTEVDNSVYSTGYSSNPYACENTFDKVFLLSYREVTNSAYGFESSSTYDTARQMITSDFSRATGAYMNTESSYYGIGNWWLRSPSDGRSDSARDVYFGYADHYFNVYVDNRGVVPALNLTLS